MQAVEHSLISEKPVSERPFDTVMAIWARWMRLKDSQHSTGDGNPQDTKEFMATGEAISAMVDDLPRMEWWAIMRSRGIATVWLFPGASFPNALARAEELLMPKMLKSVAVKRYFH